MFWRTPTPLLSKLKVYLYSTICTMYIVHSPKYNVKKSSDNFFSLIPVFFILPNTWWGKRSKISRQRVTLDSIAVSLFVTHLLGLWFKEDSGDVIAQNCDVSFLYFLPTPDWGPLQTGTAGKWKEDLIFGNWISWINWISVLSFRIDESLKSIGWILFLSKFPWQDTV